MKNQRHFSFIFFLMILFLCTQCSQGQDAPVVNNGAQTAIEQKPPLTNDNLSADPGPSEVTVPDLVGKKYEAALEILNANHLFATRQEVINDTAETNTVLGIKPSAGQTIAIHSEIELTVSKESPWMDLPNVVGKPVEEAKEMLSDLGLVPDIAKDKVGTHIAKQSPKAGVMLKLGSKVTLFLE